jgi:predicted dehydrogenase
VPAEIRVICDLYDGNLKRARESCTSTKARMTKEWQKANVDRDVDVVVIATLAGRAAQ